MALVTRRYALVGPALVQLQELVSPTVTIPATYSLAVIDISIDNAVSGIITALDEEMALAGYVNITTSAVAWNPPDLSGFPQLQPWDSACTARCAQVAGCSPRSTRWE